MEIGEVKEAIERAEGGDEKRIGVTMAIIAVLLAIITMVGHRRHTEEVVLQTRVADQWAFYQSRNIRAQMYAADAKLAMLVPNGRDLGAEFVKESEEQKNGADELRREAERLDDETRKTAKNASYFDYSEVLVEISIVLCSITLLTRNHRFWAISFVSTSAGILLALFGALR
jgi:uncharacterized protein DUF4337